MLWNLKLEKSRSHWKPNLECLGDWLTEVICFPVKKTSAQQVKNRWIHRHDECSSFMILKLITDRITFLFLLRISVCSCAIRLPSYINATQSVLETFKMARYFSHTYTHIHEHADTQLQIHLYTHTYMSITFLKSKIVKFDFYK